MGFPENIKLQSNSQPQTRTQSPLIYSRKGIWKGNLTRTKALFFRPSLDAPRTHQILPINHSAYREATRYESDSALCQGQGQVSALQRCPYFLLNINSGSASFYKKAFTCSSGAVNGYIKKNHQNDNSYYHF